jgi:RNA polymerase sigma factor (sigma-70 family)
LLLRFDADSERAAEKYELMRRQLIKFFECRNCTIAQELADETINRVTRKISEGETILPNALSAYFYGVARNVWREHINNPEKTVFSIDDPESAHHSIEPLAADSHLNLEKALLEQMLECLDSCLGELSEKEQEIVLVYYEGECGAKIANRKKIASLFDMNINNLRIRVYRIREKLERCVQLCSSKTATG